MFILLINCAITMLHNKNIHTTSNNKHLCFPPSWGCSVSGSNLVQLASKLQVELALLISSCWDETLCVTCSSNGGPQEIKRPSQMMQACSEALHTSHLPTLAKAIHIAKTNINWESNTFCLPQGQQRHRVKCVEILKERANQEFRKKELEII